MSKDSGGVRPGHDHFQTQDINNYFPAIFVSIKVNIFYFSFLPTHRFHYLQIFLQIPTLTTHNRFPVKSSVSEHFTMFSLLNPALVLILPASSSHYLSISTSLCSPSSTRSLALSPHLHLSFSFRRFPPMLYFAPRFFVNPLPRTLYLHMIHFPSLSL